MELNKIDDLILRTEKTISKVNKTEDEYLVGVDLGTAYIVIVVMDSNMNPVACEMEYAQVVRDGLVVDYMGALQIVKRLKSKLEERVGRELVNTAIAIPPGVSEADTKSHRHIVEGAGFLVTNVLDEPTAANSVIGLKNGAIVDIGGGTTGISILKDGKVIKVMDEATGGTHLSLVIAGNYNISFDEAEDKKKDINNQDELLPIVRPVIQKMASIISNNIQGYDVEDIHLVGGTCSFKGFEKIIQDEVGKRTHKPINPLLVTPIGIAMNC